MEQLQRHRAHERALAEAMAWDRPFTVTKLANNGSFEYLCTYNTRHLPGNPSDSPYIVF